MLITEAIELLKAYNGPLGLTLRDGAGEVMISKVESTYGIILPEDFKTFYRFANGFETEEDMFNMIRVEEIIDNYNDCKAEFWIAEYMIYCDMWSVRIDPENHDKYTINYGDLILTDSLGDFIARFLNGGVFDPGGLYTWHNDFFRPEYKTEDPKQISILTLILWVALITLVFALLHWIYSVKPDIFLFTPISIILFLWIRAIVRHYRRR